jgi:hypothetical protein
VPPAERYCLAPLIFDTEDGGDTFLEMAVHILITGLYIPQDGNIQKREYFYLLQSNWPFK